MGKTTIDGRESSPPIVWKGRGRKERCEEDRSFPPLYFGDEVQLVGTSVKGWSNPVMVVHRIIPGRKSRGWYRGKPTMYGLWSPTCKEYLRHHPNSTLTGVIMYVMRDEFVLLGIGADDKPEMWT